MFEDDALVFGFNSFPSHSHVFEEDAPDFGFISLPSKIQVFVDEAPVFGFNTLPSQTQLLGNSILFDITFSFSCFNRLNFKCVPQNQILHIMSEQANASIQRKS